MTIRRVLAAIALATIGVLAIADLVKHETYPWRSANDLPAFYCAGNAVRHERSPYTIEPLLSCERNVEPSRFSNDPSTVLPAPLPPYDFPPYALLSLLPYPAAKIAAAIAIAAAAFVSAFALADLGVPLVAAFAALALADAFVGVNLGQTYPFAVALLCLAAAALRRGHATVTGILAALTTVEPSLGLAICIVAFVCVPKARASMVLVGAVLFATGVAALGAHGFVVWAAQVIPQMARAEATFYGQYTLAAVLATGGLPHSAALAIGDLVYVVSIAVAVWLAKRAADLEKRPEYAILIPAAFAVAFSTYAHIQAMAAAVPLALVLCSRDRRGASWQAVAALILLAIPWTYLQAQKPLFFSCIVVALAIVLTFRLPAPTAVALVIGTAAIAYLLGLSSPHAVLAEHAPIAGAHPTLASSFYRPDRAFDPQRTLAKLPTWTGLLMLVGLTLRLGIPRYDAAPEIAIP